MATARGAPQGVGDGDDTETVFEQGAPVSFTADGGETIVFTCKRIVESRAKRLVHHERPFRPGAKIDSTNWRVRRWALDCCFNNTLIESGIDNDVVLYPTQLNALLRSFDIEETGDLVLPTRGLRRVKAASYERIEDVEAWDEANVKLAFDEDSEDDVGQDAFTDPSVRAGVVRLAQQTQFSAQSIGAWDENLSSLSEFATDIENLLASPFTTLEDIQAENRRNQRAIRRIHRAHENTGRRVGGLFHETEGASASRQLVELEDMMGKAEIERTASKPKTRTISAPEDTDLFSLAASIGQDPVAVLELNAHRIEDPMDLRQGDPVRVFA